ncbi:MAG: aminotransferase class I/II-fold pyridoxal phosphate-dependent enzyme [Chloroflexota bacterium]
MIQEASIWEGTTADYLIHLKGHLLDRLQPHTDWWNARYAAGIDPFSKSSVGRILSEGQAMDRLGRSFQGVNLASQDYLALASHPKIIQAAKEAAETYGVHSAGSAALMGNSAPSVALEEKLAAFVGKKSCTLFPTGWSAGYGAIHCLVKSDDYVVIDYLAHACLMAGSRAATKNVHTFPHLSLRGLEHKLRTIRKNNKDAGILVVTESLFSMDSDTPDLAAHQELANKYNATLLVDVAHDLGCLGPTGRGHLEVQNMLDKVDIIMGSFSKTFASNGGFVATDHPALKLALRYGSNPLAFSNAISPVQASTVLKVLEIVESEEGRQLRQQMLSNAIYLRERLSAYDFELIGNPSAIVPVQLGNMKRSRMIVSEVLQRGGLVNLVEYPAVSRTNSRVRLQVMASHTTEQLDRFVDILVAARQAVYEIGTPMMMAD